MKKTARYCVRAPLALSRLSYGQEKDLVSDTYTNLYDTCEYTEKITPHELIARLMTHIPDRWEYTTRYFAWYSNRTRGVRKKRKPLCGDQKGAGEEREVRAPTHWRRADPLVRLQIYDLRGRLVRTLVDGRQEAGTITGTCQAEIEFTG